MPRSVYLDYQATTPVDPRVVEAMLPYFGEKFGNAASRSHRWGSEAEKAVEGARSKIAALAGAAPREIVFTSGATESDNLAILGAAEAMSDRGRHVITVATEHKAVLDPCRRLQERGWRLTVLAPNSNGLVDLGAFRTAISAETTLVSAMYANNEIGVIHQIREIGTLCREKGVVFHCDAVQAFGKVPVNVEKDQVDLMSVSAHKLYGPKGIGALFIRRRNPRVALLPQILGGGHERGFRSGTLNVPGIVAFGEACAICAHEMEHEGRRLRSLRDRLLLRLTSELPDVRVNGSIVDRLPNNLNVSFAGIDSEALLMGMPEIALSTGSACTSAMVEPSYVLRAIGVPDDLARGSVRFGLGRSTTEEDIEYVADRVIATVQALRALSPTGGRQTGISRRQLVLPEQAPES